MSEFLAEAQVLISPNTAGFAAALKAQVEAAVVAAGPAVIPITAAPLATGAVATETAAATKAVRAQAVALGEDTRAFEVAGAAATRDARTQVLNAKARGQATRAIEAQIATLGGVRGAVLTASTPFLVATAAAIVFAKSIREASNETEELNKNAVIFGSSAKGIEDFAKTTATSLGISSTEALRATGIFGNLFRTLKLSEPVSAGMSEQLVKLASDLASFNNADPSRVLEALRSGLVGQARPLRVFGIFISQARAQQEALIETGKKQTTQLTNAELVQARYNIILKDSALAQGDFARTSDRLANQSRILKANLANLAAEIGSALIPGLTDLAVASSDLFRIFKDFKKVGEDGSQSLDRAAGSSGFFAGQLKEAETAFGRLLVPGRQVRFVLDHVAEGMDRVAGTTNAAVAAVERAQESLPAATTQIAKLANAFQEGGGRQSSTALNEFVVGLQKLEAAESSGLVTNDQLAGRIRNLIKLLQDPTAFNINIKAALDERGLVTSARQGANAVVDTLNGVLSPSAAHAIGFNFLTEVGQGAKDAAPKAGEDAGKAFVLNLSSQVAVAQATGSDAQQLSALRARLAKRREFLNSLLNGDRPVTQALIQKASANVESDKTAIQSILDKQASAQREATQQAEQNQETATQDFVDKFTNRGSNLQEQLSRASQSDNLKLQISINRAIIANDKKEIAALQARIKHLHLQGQALKDARDAIAAAQKEIRDTLFEISKEQAQQKQNAQDVLNQKLDLRIQIADTRDNVKAQIAARKAKLKEITRELVAAKKEFGKNSLAWLQLKEAQAEQIKAIHDLQNQNKTAGKDSRKEAAEFLFSQLQAQQGFASNLLGNLIPSGQTAGLVGNPAPASSVSVAAQTADGKSKTSPTAGQHNTTNELLRRILHALERQNRADQAPEARHNRHVGAAIMDGSGGIHGA